MARRTNKSIAEILTPIEASSSNTHDNDLLSSSFERKITLATEGFTTSRFCELILRDRSRLSKEDALTVCDYIISMKRLMSLCHKIPGLRGTCVCLKTLKYCCFINLILPDILLVYPTTVNTNQVYSIKV
jgi:hypothetical protein